MTTITSDDIRNPANKYVLLNTEHASPFIASLHGTEGAANNAARRAGAGGRIAGRHRVVAALDGPAPSGYRDIYPTMRDYLIDA